MLSGLGVPDLRETNSTFTYAGTDVTADQVKHPPGGGVMVRLELQGDRARFDLEGPSDPGGDGERMTRARRAHARARTAAASANVGGKTIALQPRRVERLGRARVHARRRAACAASASCSLLEAGKQLRAVRHADQHSSARAVLADLVSARVLRADRRRARAPVQDRRLGPRHQRAQRRGRSTKARSCATWTTIEKPRTQMLLDRLSHDDWDLLIWVSTATDRVGAHVLPADRSRSIRATTRRSPSATATRSKSEYERMDATVAAVLERLRPDDTLLILSDHGFHDYRRGLHVNQWLRKQGLLALNAGADSSSREFLLDVDWSKTKAYALGTGQIYLNLQGTRAARASSPTPTLPALLKQIRDGLIALRDEQRDGRAGHRRRVRRRGRVQGRPRGRSSGPAGRVRRELSHQLGDDPRRRPARAVRRQLRRSGAAITPPATSSTPTAS